MQKLIVIFLSLLTINKSNSTSWQKNYSSIVGSIGNTTTRSMTKYLNNGNQLSKNIFQCSGPLPVGILPSILGPLTQLQHTWLKINNKTYGMPFTIKRTYFGGKAYFMSPDPFIAKNLIHKDSIICDPISYKKIPSKNIEKFEKRVSCIIEKLSKASSDNESSENWVATLDYHGIDNNCSSAVRFATDCANVQFSQTPNLNVGSFYNPDKAAEVGYPVHIKIFKKIKDDLKKLKVLRRNQYFKRKKILSSLQKNIKAYFIILEEKESSRNFDLRFDIKENKDKASLIFKELGENIFDQILLKLELFISDLPKYQWIKSTYADICYKARNECHK